MRVIRWCPVVVLAIVAACSGGGDSNPASSPTPIPSPSPTGTGTVAVALADLGTGNYLGFQGGHYPGGSNTMPAAHASAGLAAAAAIAKLDTAGNASVSGKYVMISVGMSNTTQEFCSQPGTEPCDLWTFMGQAAADIAVEKTDLVLVNGARGGQSAATWDSPSDPNWDDVDLRLAAKGLSPLQVQIAWVKVANPNPSNSLPATNADAYTLVGQIGSIARALKTRYPNMKQMWVSNRIYAGYATTTLNPEPYAYESGFAVKWVVEAQITQNATGTIDTRAGDLSSTAAPWIAWGSDLWADGTNARGDGLTWVTTDFQSDGTHPAQSGEEKVGTLLLDHFKTEPRASCWFLAGQSC